MKIWSAWTFVCVECTCVIDSVPKAILIYLVVCLTESDDENPQAVRVSATECRLSEQVGRHCMTAVAPS